MQAIAAENKLSETAFIRPEGPAWSIRWLTRVAEVDLCGHATLASAAVGVPEDPVTGSAHCSLVPVWSERLGKTELTAGQRPARGGTLRGRDRGDVGGRAVLYLQGTIQFQPVSR